MQTHSALVHLGVSEALLDRLHAFSEQVHVELLKAGTGDAAVEVDALIQRVNFNTGLGGGRQGSLGALAGSPEPPEGPSIACDVLLVFPLELLQLPDIRQTTRITKWADDDWCIAKG